MVRFIAILKLIRVVNCLMAAAAVWVGAQMTWVTPVYYGPAMVGLAAFLVCAAGNCVNDFVDVSIDRINRPDRVLAKGILSKRFALILSTGLNVAALILAYSVSRPVLIVALVTVALLYLYNFWLKKLPLLGNMVVSVLAGMTFMSGGIAVDYQFALELPGPLIAFWFAFLFHMVRELVKDVQDIEGDRLAGVTTLPQLIGEQGTILLGLAVFLLLVILSFTPWLYGWYGQWYKILAIYIAELPLLAFLIFVWGNPSEKMLRIASTWLKAGMLLGMVALVVG